MDPSFFVGCTNQQAGLEGPLSTAQTKHIKEGKKYKKDTLLGAAGLTTRSKDAIRGSWHRC